MRLRRTCSGLPTCRRRQISPWLILCARIKVSFLRDRILDGGLGQADPPFICGTQDKTRRRAGRDRDGLWATFLAPLPSGWRHRKFWTRSPMSRAFAVKDGVPSMQFETRDSASMLFRHVDIDLAAYPMLAWRWYIELRSAAHSMSARAKATITQ